MLWNSCRKKHSNLLKKIYSKTDNLILEHSVKKTNPEIQIKNDLEL